MRAERKGQGFEEASTQERGGMGNKGQRKENLDVQESQRRKPASRSKAVEVGRGGHPRSPSGSNYGISGKARKEVSLLPNRGVVIDDHY